MFISSRAGKCDKTLAEKTNLVFSVMSLEDVREKAVSDLRDPWIFLAFFWMFMPTISSKPLSSRDATGILEGHTDSGETTQGRCDDG